jgi:predicted TPR repeat methyltransferase
LARLLLLSLPEQIIQGGIGASLVLEAVRQGTEQIRSDLREKMVEFATVMRDYSETIAAKNTAYVEATSKTIDVISSHIETVRGGNEGGRA